MSSNRRRSHIHFVKQYRSETLEYTGTRIVIFIKEKGIKYIKDFDNFTYIDIIDLKIRDIPFLCGRLCPATLLKWLKR